MSAHQIRLHGPSGELEIELEGESPDDCLDQVQLWVQAGTLVGVKTRRGVARVHMGHVWAAEFIPSGRVIAS